jgi:hypothetical protein
MGAHRVFCGDALDPHSYRQVMDGGLADMVFNTVIHVAPATARRLPRKAAFVGFAGLNKAAMVVAFGMTSRMNSTNWGPGFDVCLAVAAV